MQDVVASCGPDGNPIHQFVRSFAAEKSDIQQDVIGGRPGHDAHHDEIERHIAEDLRQLSHPAGPGPNMALQRRAAHFLRGEQLNQLDPVGAFENEYESAWHNEFHEPHAGVLVVPPRHHHPAGGEDWAEQFAQHQHPWAEDFAHFQRHPHRLPVAEQWQREFHQREHEDLERAYHESTTDATTEQWAKDFEEFETKHGPRDADEEERQWFEQFMKSEQKRKQDSQLALAELSNKLTGIQDPKLKNSSFVKFIQKLSSGQVVINNDGQVTEGQTGDQWAAEFEGQTQTPAPAANQWASEFERTLRGNTTEEQWAADFQAHRALQEQAAESEWAKEFERMKLRETSATESSEQWAEQFEKIMQRPEEEWASEFENLQRTAGNSVLGNATTSFDNYEFEQNNPYVNHEAPFKRGLELLQKGQISEAILAFEAEVQRNPENGAAWRTLGQAHAQNDKDDRAIAALRRAVKINSNDMDALIALGVSYTNEMYREEALEALEKWISTHERYREISAKIRTSADEYGNEYDEFGEPVDKQDKVTEMFLEAARSRPAEPDPDVQIALGLLFNLSFEYEKAVDCFALALQKRPDDHLLWNKLGATLANSNRSEEAIEVYLKALDYNPNFVRARANLGISFLALKRYDQAARQFLTALKQQPNAKHIWQNLRTTFSAMERPDLLQKTMRHDWREFTTDFDL